MKQTENWGPKYWDEMGNEYLNIEFFKNWTSLYKNWNLREPKEEKEEGGSKKTKGKNNKQELPNEQRGGR